MMNMEVLCGSVEGAPILTNVSYDQANDISGAQYVHLITNSVTKSTGLNLNLTESNVKS